MVNINVSGLMRYFIIFSLAMFAMLVATLQVNMVVIILYVAILAFGIIAIGKGIQSLIQDIGFTSDQKLFLVAAGSGAILSAIVSIAKNVFSVVDAWIAQAQLIAMGWLALVAIATFLSIIINLGIKKGN